MTAMQFYDKKQNALEAILGNPFLKKASTTERRAP